MLARWVRDVCVLLDEGNDIAGLDLLYAEIDDLLLKEKFDYVDRLLTKPLVGMHTDLILGLLCSTFPARKELYHWQCFKEKAKAELAKRGIYEDAENLPGG